MFIHRRTLAALAAVAAMQLSTAAEESAAAPSAATEEMIVHGKPNAVELDRASVRVDVQRHRKSVSSSLDAALGRSAVASAEERGPRG